MCKIVQLDSYTYTEAKQTMTVLIFFNLMSKIVQTVL